MRTMSEPFSMEAAFHAEKGGSDRGRIGSDRIRGPLRGRRLRRAERGGGQAGCVRRAVGSGAAAILAGILTRTFITSNFHVRTGLID